MQLIQKPNRLSRPRGRVSLSASTYATDPKSGKGEGKRAVYEKAPPLQNARIECALTST